MGLVPVTEELLAELTGPRTGGEGTEPERGSFGSFGTDDSTRTMSQAFGRTLGLAMADWSRGGRIARAETDFHGGHGHQTAAVREAGATAWGPVLATEFTGPREQRPINSALARLGVVPGGSETAEHHDLFLAVGLGRERDTDGWREAGRAARWAAHYNEWHREEEAELARVASAAAKFERRRRLPAVPAALDGKAIMELLGLPPGPLIGAAARHLQELHLERGPLAPEKAAALLRARARHQQPRAAAARNPPW